MRECVIVKLLKGSNSNDNKGGYIAMMVNTNKLRAAIKFQAKADSRFYLCGFRINEEYIEATNGHVAVRMDNCEGFTGDYILNLIGAIPAKAVKTEFLISDCVAKHFDINDKLVGAQAFDVIEGKFPDLSGVIPVESCKGEFPAIQIKYMSIFEKAFKKGGLNYCAVKPVSYDSFKAAVFKLCFESDNEEFGSPVIIIMPTRED